VPRDLNGLIPAGARWLLTEARDINDSGQIVGTGIFDGQVRAFLLTPAGGGTLLPVRTGFETIP